MKNFLFIFILVTVSAVSVLAQTASEPVHGNPQIGSFAFYESKNIQRQEMDLFAAELKRDNGKIGVIVLTKNKDYKNNKIAFYTKQIKNYLTRQKGIALNRLTFYNGGLGMTAKADLYLLSKTAMVEK